MSDSPTIGSKAVQHPDAARYTVGDLLIDVGRQRVTRGESVIALPKLSYELLLALVRAAPNLVSLDELMERVWPKAVVSPETLSQRVKLLRDALGDDPRAPRYIEGLRGRGYRLIPLVASEELVRASAVARPEEPVHAPAEQRASALMRLRRRPFLWVGLIAVAVIALALLVLLAMHASPKSGTSVEVVAVEPRAVAVLPFDNLSAEPNNEYIALGVADAVLNQLASVPELIVVARSSSFALGKPTPEAREAGRRLGVRYLVTGSVQRAGNMLRVTAQLTDTTTNAALWSMKLDRAIDSVFELQDQISQRVAQQLDVTLRGRTARYAQYGTDAYLAFLRGRALIESRKLKDVQESVRQFSRAVELAPTFAAAIAELARAKWQLESFETNERERMAQVQPELMALLDRAIQIDPTAGEAYFLRAMLVLDPEVPPAPETQARAEADFRKGLELAPSFGAGLRGYAEYLDQRGRLDEALVQIDRARLVDPLSAENHYRKGEFLRMELFKYQDAAALFMQALSVQPEFYPAYTRLAQVRWETGHLAEAIRYAEKSVAIEPAAVWTGERLLQFYVDIGDLAAARDVLRSYPAGAAQMAAAEALVCYRAANPERAFNILRTNIRRPDFNAAFAFWIVTNAVLEQAISHRDPAMGRQVILSSPMLVKTGTVLPVVEDNFPTIVQLAVLEHAVGNPANANDSAQRILEYLDRNPERHFLGGWDEWARAAASAIMGRDDAALGHLENLERSGSLIGWWARIEQDPAFVALRSSTRFRALVSRLNLWQQNETQQLARMRLSGEVPRRSTDQLTVNGC